ncbi:MAG: hypothetical protein SOR57_11350 [Parabacteroides sp.]|nr:hypothetical protein [Parabacteroides sp.]
MRNNILFLILFSFLFVSCVNSLDDQKDSLQEDNLLLFGENILVEDGTLNFKDENSLKLVLEGMKQSQGILQLKGESQNLIANTDYILPDNKFRSMYDLYEKASEEAYLYYNDWDSYNLFKKKYSNLYFPEVGDDYSAYLPISNKDLAKLANVEGYIKIDGKMIDCKDVDSYEDLDSLGWSIPSEAGIRKSNSVEIIHYNNGKDLVWVDVFDLGYSIHGTYLLKIEVNFREKGFLGIWYNRRASTNIKAWFKNESSNVFRMGGKEKFSSHDYSPYFDTPLPYGTFKMDLVYGPLGGYVLSGSHFFPLPNK